MALQGRISYNTVESLLHRCGGQLKRQTETGGKNQIVTLLFFDAKWASLLAATCRNDGGSGAITRLERLMILAFRTDIGVCIQHLQRLLSRRFIPCCYKYVVVIVALTFFAPALLRAADFSGIHISANRTIISEGSALTLSAKLLHPSGVTQCTLWPYVNGKQWGASEIVDRAGQATWRLPLPDRGTTQIVVSPAATTPAASAAPACAWSHRFLTEPWLRK